MFYQPEGKYAAGLPDMPLQLYCAGIESVPDHGAFVEMYCVKPYKNKGWDGLRVNYYVAPQCKIQTPLLLEKGNIIYLAAESKVYLDRAVSSPV